MITHMLASWLRLVEEKYKDWEENYPPTEIEFEVDSRTGAGQGSIQMVVTPAGKNEPKTGKSASSALLRFASRLHVPGIQTCELAID